MDQKQAHELTATVRRAAEGDQEAWQQIVEQYSALVWSVARRHRLGEAATADAVQTTWLALVEHLSSIRDPCALPGWLATTARHASLQVLRQATRLTPLDEREDLVGTAETPEVTVLRHERVAMVRTAMGRLSERDQDLLTVLVADPPVAYTEISRRLDMPVGSIGPTRMRALARLRARLETVGALDAALS